MRNSRDVRREKWNEIRETRNEKPMKEANTSRMSKWNVKIQTPHHEFACFVESILHRYACTGYMVLVIYLSDGSFGKFVPEPTQLSASNLPNSANFTVLWLSHIGWLSVSVLFCCAYSSHSMNKENTSVQFTALPMLYENFYFRFFVSRQEQCCAQSFVH